MQRTIANNLAYYTFDSLRDSGALVHAISTRHGGVSPAPFHTLNLSRFVGDDSANVAHNLGRLHSALGLDERATISASQAQADEVAIVGTAQCGTVLQNVDALVTNEPDIPLFLRYADCVPILFYDPTHRAIGVVHAGWRGTVLKIAAKTAQKMTDAFGTRPRDLIACIAPSIGPCCYAVGDEVITRVREQYANADELLHSNNGHIHFDLWQANTHQLRQLGVEQIEIAQLCTAHHTDDFFSYRAEKQVTGRFGALIALSR